MGLVARRRCDADIRDWSPGPFGHEEVGYLGADSGRSFLKGKAPWMINRGNS
jgi:hypothetical protein